MTPQDAARVMSALHGAFPYANIDDDTIRVWSNVLDNTDFNLAMAAVDRWVAVEKFWPTIAELNGVMSEVRREWRGDTDRPIVNPLRGALRCDSSGWLDRGDGMEPCPACNPWLRERWQSGNFDRSVKPPNDFDMPAPCHPSHAGEGAVTTSKHRAMQLVINGLREQLTDNGLSPAEVDAAVARRMPAVLAAIANVGG